MSETKIEWADYTFNAWVGCSKVSPACKNCYAESWAKRSGLVQWGDSAERRRTSEANWRTPLKWNKEAAKAGERRRVFCASLADVFEDHPSIQPGWRADLGRLILDTPNLDWLLLTKRPENVMRLAPDFWVYVSGVIGELPKNVWIGTTVENQEMADRRIPELLKIPAAVRFLSCEPLLGPVDLFEWIAHSPSSTWKPPIHWVIVGGESGPHARPMHPDWARKLRDECAGAGVKFFMKQWGEWEPYEFGPDSMHVDTKGAYHDGHRLNIIDPETGDVAKGWEIDDDYSVAFRKVGKKVAGRILDWREYNEFPEAA